jgi:hypothetical protein
LNDTDADLPTPRTTYIEDSHVDTQERMDRSLTDQPTELTMKRYRLNVCAILAGLGVLALIEIADYFGFAR